MTYHNARRVFCEPLLLVGILICSGLGGCESGLIAAGSATGVAVLAGMPTDDIEQVYYLGALDPQGQVPSTIYRVTVRGQSGAINNTRFGSGWVRAELIDSLGSKVSFDNDKISVTGESQRVNELGSGRRMVMFGPEGFREAPRDHRLVMVMGADPKAFFAAMDEALGTYAEVQIEREDSAVRKHILDRLEKLRRSRDRVQDVLDDLSSDLEANK